MEESREEEGKEEEEEEEEVESGKCDGRSVEVRVLVVDDSPVDRRIVESLLKRCGSGALFQVTAVDSGKKAMEVLGFEEGKAECPVADDHKIDIILTDYCMPEMTGYDLLKAVKEQTCRKSIPVVIMSSENEPQRISRCRAIGAEDFIQKPLQTKDVDRLRNYASRPASVSAKAGTKRKAPLDLRPENSEPEKRPRRTGLAAA